MEPDEWTDEVVGQVTEVIRDRAEQWEALGMEAPPVYHVDAVFKLVLLRIMADTGF
ncbi:hypothetical protein [Nocardioides euryhalodurans]|uniref:hypothetical protein n=1 Tax=Nocardioides euryhalodurans TaxID=2518370 RepID=UPI00141E116B|nr:hypothetical protein [Nocardioides euryhalodurans]